MTRGGRESCRRRILRLTDIKAGQQTYPYSSLDLSDSSFVT